MPFDMGFDFRSSSGYVTDPSYGVPQLAASENYPHTYTNGDGYSINAGWVATGAPVGADRDNTNDPRIAGINFVSNNTTGETVRIDLTSGSAPGSGAYTIDLAVGDAVGASTHFFSVLDDATTLIDGTNGGSGYATDAGHFIDATLADVTASTTWTGTTVSKTFNNATCYIKLGNGAGGALSRIAHFRLTLQGGDARREHIAFGIGRGILIGR